MQVGAAMSLFRGRRILGIALLLWIGQAVLLATVSPSPVRVFCSKLFEVAVAVLSVITAFAAYRRSGPYGKLFWSLATIGLSILATGIIFVTYNNNPFGAPVLRWWVVDAFVMSWTAPLLMCVLLDPGEAEHKKDWQRMLDFAQVGIVFLMLQLYSSNLQDSQRTWGLALITDGVIATGFLARAFACRHTPLLRKMFLWFGTFRLVAAITDLGFIFGYLAMYTRPRTPGWFDLVWSGTLLFPVIAAAGWDDVRPHLPEVQPNFTYRRLLLSQLGPLVFPTLTLAMAARVARTQLLLAAVATLLSLAISYARLLVTQKQQYRSEEAVQQSHRLLEAVIEGSSEVIFLKDLDGRYLISNSASARWHGGDAKSVIGKTSWELFPEETARRMYEQDQRVIKTGAVVSDDLEFKLPDGTKRTFLTKKRPYRDAKGNIIGIIGISFDNTELRSFEERLNMQSRLEAIGTLSGGVAHDFNNLLTIILGYNSMVLDLAKDATIKNCAEQVEAAAGKAANLTRQLLAFSRRQMLQPKVVNLNSVLASLDEMLQRLIGEDVELETVTSDDLGSIKADPGQLEQVIMNLVANARDAMPKGGKLTIELANVELDEDYARDHAEVVPGNYVMLAISDTGEGMNPATLSRIFEPFFTTKTLDRGTGLGLAMVYGIVKQSGGSISVYSELNEGTTFKIFLPRVEEAAEPSSANKLLGENCGSETILLVEDDQQIRQLAKTVLKDRGYNVIEAEGPVTAIALCKEYEQKVDLLVTDVVMPVMGGREMAAQIVKQRPEIKVLYMSGYTNNAIVHHGVLDSDISFLPKPFTPHSLAAKVRQVLDQTQPSRSATSSSSK